MVAVKYVNKSLFLFLFLCSSAHLIAQKKSNNIAMVMPFCSKQILANPDCYDAQLGNLCREYYQGALIALDSFERAKVAVTLSVFDTENDSMTLLRILQKTQLKSSELIIGPVLQGGNKLMSGFVKETGVYHISPLMTFSKTRLDDAFWISANPDIPTYATFLYNYIVTQNHDSANIIIVSDKSPLDKNITTVLKQIIPKSKTVSIKFVEYERGFNMIKYLSQSLTNHIILPSSNEATVNGVFKNIKDTNDGFTMTTYGFPQWLEFKNMDYEVWQRMNVTVLSPYFIDYDNEQVKIFIESYRARFYTEPTEAAFKGYDQLLLFGMELATNGKNFISKMENKTFSTLNTRYYFKRQEEGASYQNYFLNVLKLEELKLRRVN